MPAAYARLNAGNATAMMDLRDVAMFDGAALTDGYAGLMSQIGIRTQSANYAATVSASIAANLERDRASARRRLRESAHPPGTGSSDDAHGVPGNAGDRQ